MVYYINRNPRTSQTTAELVFTWEEIAEADLQYGGEGEVAGVQVTPVLPLGEHDGASGQVANQHVDTGCRGHDHLLANRSSPWRGVVGSN